MALQGAAVGASAAVGCGSMAVAVYAHVAKALRRQEAQGNDDCAAQIIATVCGVSRQLLTAPELVRNAYTDPVEELRKAREANERCAAAEFSLDGRALESGYAVFNGEVLRAGPSFEAVEPVLALGGAEASESEGIRH